MVRKPLATLMATVQPYCPSGDSSVWPSGPPPRSKLRRGASIAPRRRTAGALRHRARPAEAANVLLRPPSPRQTMPGAWSERRRSSGAEDQAQILHAGSDPDHSPLQPQAIARWRRSWSALRQNHIASDFSGDILIPNSLISATTQPAASSDRWTVLSHAVPQTSTNVSSV